MRGVLCSNSNCRREGCVFKSNSREQEILHNVTHSLTNITPEYILIMDICIPLGVTFIIHPSRMCFLYLQPREQDYTVFVLMYLILLKTNKMIQDNYSLSSQLVCSLSNSTKYNHYIF